MRAAFGGACISTSFNQYSLICEKLCGHQARVSTGLLLSLCDVALEVVVARSVLLPYLGVRDVVDHNDTVGAAEVRVRHCLEPAPQDDGTRTFVSMMIHAFLFRPFTQAQREPVHLWVLRKWSTSPVRPCPVRCAHTKESRNQCAMLREGRGGTTVPTAAA